MANKLNFMKKKSNQLVRFYHILQVLVSCKNSLKSSDSLFTFVKGSTCWKMRAIETFSLLSSNFLPILAVTTPCKYPLLVKDENLRIWGKFQRIIESL